MAVLRLNLVVLKTTKADELLRFYSALGIVFSPEQHEGVPPHHAGKVGSLVLEIFPVAISTASTDVRFGFEVPDIAETVRSLGLAGFATDRIRPKQTPWGLRAVTHDPDGRAVELYQELSNLLE